MRRYFSLIVLVLTGMLTLSGCASYNAAPLNTLSSEVIRSSSSKSNNVFVAAKAYDRMDCKRYLDRDVISNGYQPIQLYIQNNSDKYYSFSLNRLDLPFATQDEVVRKVHTSTVGRILGYGVPGVLVLWPLVIPAVVDGIKSSEANEALDYDFSSKVARDQVIGPHSYLNKIIFVPVGDFRQSFNITLIDQESNEPDTIIVQTA